MKPITFRRQDVVVRVAEERDDVVVSAYREVSGAPIRRTAIDPARLRPADVVGAGTASSRELIAARVRPLIRQLVASVNRREAATPPDERSQGRLVLDIQHAALRTLPWEQAFEDAVKSLRPVLGALVIVRRSPTRWRDQQVPYSFPLRFLQFRDVRRFSIGRVLEARLESAPGASNAVATAEIWVDELDTFRSEAGWPAAHVIHLSALPNPGEAAPLSTAQPSQPGTLGWISRLADTWQTRLVVIETSSDVEATRARMLAHRVADRGGPAVLVADRVSPDFFDRFYGRLLRDEPIDVALSGSTNSTLVVGGGRSEAIRVSAIPRKLVETGAAIESMEAAGRTSRDVFVVPRTAHGDLLLNRLDAGTIDLAGLLSRSTHFRDPSSDGFLIARSAIASEVSKWWAEGDQFTWNPNHLVAAGNAVARLRKRAGIHSPGQRPTASETERFVRPALLDVNHDLIPQSHSVIRDHPLHLAVQIGARDHRVQVVGATGILEEVFRWTPDMDGAWIDVGVTGIDFEIVGDPVQQIWLPRTGPSDEALFTVIPHRAPVSLLRFCLYYRNDIVQSFRIGATVRGDKDALIGGSPIQRAAQLARSLAVDGRAGVAPGWAARLEYGLSSSFPDAGRANRTVSLVANDRDDESTITIKADDVYIETTADLGEYVKSVRHAMDPDPKAKYPFGGVVTDDLLRETFHRMAGQGWQLYSQIVPAHQRAKLAKALSEDGQTIHVAEVIAEKVIPWAAMYDRTYDRDSVDENGDPSVFDVCPAGFPGPDGTPSANECKVSKSCLLSPSQAEARAAGAPALKEETVSCPRGFWGFRHVIELPMQQADADESVPPLPSPRPVPAPLSASISFNSTIAAASAHVEQVSKILQTTGGVQPATPEWLRPKILADLARPDIQVAYVLCHAYGDRAKGFFPPYLEFNRNPSAIIRPEQLHADRPWSNAPLVVLNACGTGAVSPDAISPLIKTLMRDCRAGGVLATEISVWIPLAIDAGEVFIEEYARGKPSGLALLTTRLRLLAKRNPMGLAYTLYGFTDRRLAG